MTKRIGTKHIHQQVTGYWNEITLTGMLCPRSIGSFTIRFKNDIDHRPEIFPYLDA